jgi:hypothetical protein
MKIIITENQYKLLKEDRDNDFEEFLLKRFPYINDLEVIRYRTPSSGPVRAYIKPDNEKYKYFRVISRIEPTFTSGVGTKDKDEFIRLYVSSQIYTYSKNFGMNFEFKLMDWFNKTYDENVNSVLKSTNSNR